MRGPTETDLLLAAVFLLGMAHGAWLLYLYCLWRVRRGEGGRPLL